MMSYTLLLLSLLYYYYFFYINNNCNLSPFTSLVSLLLLTVEHRLHSRDELQLEEYLVKKAELAGIMRDFTDNKSYFIAIDGSLVAMTEYQEISKRIKRGTTYCTLRTL